MAMCYMDATIDLGVGGASPSRMRKPPKASKYPQASSPTSAMAKHEESRWGRTRRLLHQFKALDNLIVDTPGHEVGPGPRSVDSAITRQDPASRWHAHIANVALSQFSPTTDERVEKVTNAILECPLVAVDVHDFSTPRRKYRETHSDALDAFMHVPGAAQPRALPAPLCERRTSITERRRSILLGVSPGGKADFHARFLDRGRLGALHPSPLPRVARRPSLSLSHAA